MFEVIYGQPNIKFMIQRYVYMRHNPDKSSWSKSVLSKGIAKIEIKLYVSLDYTTKLIMHN